MISDYHSKSHCPWHPDRISVLQCENCGVYACDECIIVYHNKKLCPVCRKKWFKYKFMAFSVTIAVMLVMSGLVFGIYLKLKSESTGTLSDQLIESLNKNPNDDVTRMKLVTILATSKKYSDARKHLKILIERNPRNKHVLLRYILYSVKDNDSESALIWAKKAQNIFPDDPEFFKVEGDIWLSLGKNEDCEKMWLKAYALGTRDFDVVIKLADLFIEEHRYIEAKKILLDNWIKFDGVRKKKLGDYLFKLEKIIKNSSEKKKNRLRKSVR